MNYAIVENESICSDLGNIADWLREKDENISPKNRKRLDKLAKKIESCSSELEAIVADHYKDWKTISLEECASKKPIYGCSRVSAISRGTLMGIKKACRKL